MIITASLRPPSAAPSLPPTSFPPTAIKKSRVAEPALQERLPALITGDVGTGKSTAFRAFVHTLDRNLFPVAYLANPQLKVTTLFSQILLALQVEPAYSFNRLLPQLHTTLADLARQGRYLLLILDEAHRLPPDIFDQLRFLFNDQMDSASLLTLVLLGQPDLAQLLRFAPGPPSTDCRPLPTPPL